MELPPLLPPGQDEAASSSGVLTGGQNLGQQDFLLMLLTQLNNQDPLNPMEGHEFAAQLAQFTSVEQLLSLNDSLTAQGEMFTLLAETMGESLVAQGEMLGVLSESLNRSAATGLIGLSVEVPGDMVAWTGDAPTTLAFDLDAPATAVQVTVLNESGEVVRTLTLEETEAGLQHLTWDGLDADGQPAPEGVYTFAVQATDAEGQPVGATPVMEGLVDRVSFGPDGTFVWVNGLAVPYTALRSIGWPSDAPLPEETPPESGPLDPQTFDTSTF